MGFYDIIWKISSQNIYPYRNVSELACTISEERSNQIKKTLEISQKLQTLQWTFCIGKNYSRELCLELKPIKFIDFSQYMKETDPQNYETTES